MGERRAVGKAVAAVEAAEIVAVAAGVVDFEAAAVEAVARYEGEAEMCRAGAGGSAGDKRFRAPLRRREETSEADRPSTGRAPRVRRLPAPATVPARPIGFRSMAAGMFVRTWAATALASRIDQETVGSIDPDWIGPAIESAIGPDWTAAASIDLESMVGALTGRA